MTVSLKQIAHRAGVSHAAVSMALRDHPRISEKRRIEIKALAKEMGYRPNLLARGLKGKKTNTIGMLWSLGGPHQSEELVRQFAMGMQQAGYSTFIVDLIGEVETTISTLYDLKQRGVDGVIIQLPENQIDHPLLIQALNKFDAVVAETSVSCEGLAFDTVWRDRLSSLRDIANYLLKIGRKRPAIAMPSVVAYNQSKAKAFGDVFKKVGIEFSQASLINITSQTGHFTVQDWLDSFASHIEQYGLDDIDALWCSTDEGAMAAIHSLESQGKIIPKDVSVIGFNDNPPAALFKPALASVARQSDEVVALHIRLLCERLANPHLPHRHISMPMSFIWRPSAGQTPPNQL